MVRNIYEEAPDWIDESMEKRFHSCISMLYIHGVLSATERNKVFVRLLKLKRKAKAQQTRDSGDKA